MVWIRNDTKLESICNRTNDQPQQNEEFEPWCYVNDDPMSNQEDNCISFFSGRDISFSYSPCENSYSALCKTTKNTCHSLITINSDSIVENPSTISNILRGANGKYNL